MNSVCSRCKFHENHRSPREFPVLWPPENYEIDPVDILVVTNKPWEDQEWNSVLDPNKLPYQFLTHYLNLTGLKWAIVPHILCLSNIKASDSQISKCSGQLADVVAAYQPKAILLAGEPAAKAILGGGSINKLAETVHWFTHGACKTPVVTTYHPVSHFSTGKFRRDLRNDYARAFRRLEELVRGEDTEKSHELQIIQSGVPSRTVVTAFRELLGSSASGTVGLDFEWDVNKKIPGYQTIYHPKARVFCGGISTWTGTNYSTVVADFSEWLEKDWMALQETFRISGRKFVLTQAKGDFSGVLVSSGFLRQRPPALTYHRALQTAREVFGDFEDIFLLHWLRDQSLIGNGLKSLAYKYVYAKDWSRHIHQQAKEVDLWSQVDRNDMLVYCGEDNWRTVQVWDKHGADWAEEVGPLYSFLKDVTLDLLITEWVGFPVDMNYFSHLRDSLQDSIGAAQQWLDSHPFVQAMGWKGFNAKSPQQKSNLVLALGLADAIKERTASGLVQVNKHTIKSLLSPATSPSVREFFQTMENVRVERDKCSKVFVPLSSDAIDGIIHPEYHLAKSEQAEDGDTDESTTEGTETGRLGSSIHTVPARDPVVNKGIYWPGGTLIVQDLKSIEPLVNASLAKCGSLLDVFRCAKRDPSNPEGDIYRKIYAETYSKLTKRLILPGDVTADQRQNTGKPMFLAITYDRSPWGLAHTLGCSPDEARKILDALLKEAFPEILARSGRTRRDALQGKLQKTIAGRRRTYEFILPYYQTHKKLIDRAEEFPLYELAERVKILKTDQGVLREANNMVTQAEANDINLRLKQYMARESYKFPNLYHVTTVHDSIMFVSFSKPSGVEEEINWMHETTTHPDRYLPQDILHALGWDKEALVQAEIKYGPNKAELKTWGESK